MPAAIIDRSSVENEACSGRPHCVSQIRYCGLNKCSGLLNEFVDYCNFMLQHSRRQAGIGA